MVNRNEKNDSKTMKKILIFISLLFCLAMFVFAIGAYYVIPPYIKFFSEIDQKLPEGSIIIYTYKYWIAIPIISSFFLYKLNYTDNKNSSFIYFVFILLLLAISAVIFAATSYYIFYPVFSE